MTRALSFVYFFILFFYLFFFFEEFFVYGYLFTRCGSLVSALLRFLFVFFHLFIIEINLKFCTENLKVL